MRWSFGAVGRVPRETGLLPDPGFVLPLYVRAGREHCLDLLHLGWETFLKSSSAYSFCPLCRGRTVILRNPMWEGIRASGDYDESIFVVPFCVDL